MSEIWCDNNPSADPQSIIHHWLNGVFIPDRSDEARYYSSVGKTGGFTQPETMLWISAIWQAIMDIENPIGKGADMIRFDALSWVMDESEEMGSFKFACSVLGLDPGRASKKIVGDRKIKLPKKINTCPDCGEFIRQNLKRCQVCAEIAHAEQKRIGYEAWYLNSNGRKYIRELQRKRRAGGSGQSKELQVLREEV